MALNTRVTTGKVRLSFVHLFEKHAVEEGQTPAYSVMAILPKSDKVTLAKMREAEKNAAEKDKGRCWNGTIPKVLASIIKDGDAEDPKTGEPYSAKLPEVAGSYFFTVRSTKLKPGVVDRDKNEILDQSEVYSGCYGRLALTAYGYNVSGNRGISFGLNHVQKLADGEPLGGFTRAEDAFDDLDDDDDDLL